MLSSITQNAVDKTLLLQQMEARVAEIKAEQTRLLAGNKFIDLSQASQIRWCCLNRELGRVAFDAYELLKENHDAVNAINYFQIAFYTHHDRAIEYYYNIIIVKMGFGFNLQKMQDSLKPYHHMDSESLFVQALTHILEIGERCDEVLGKELLRMSADVGHVTAQLLFGIYHSIKLKYESSVPSDKKVYYLNAAAAQGDLFAESLMAVKDYECRAHGWLNRLTNIANEGDALAQECLSKAYKDASAVEKDEATFQYWSHLAYLQGIFDAFVSRCKGDTGARSLRCGAEEQFSGAIKHLTYHSGNNKISLYHKHAFQGSVKDLCEVVTSTPGLDDEIRWDIERGIEHSTLHNFTDLLFAILDALKSRKETAKRCDVLCCFAIATLNDQRAQTASNEQSMYYSNIILKLLERVNLVALDDIDDIVKIIYPITDAWYDFALSRYDVADQMQLTRMLADYIETIILNLSVRKLTILDQHALHQCGVIIVSSAYDCQYEACVQHISFEVLLAFISLRRLRPSMNHEEMNHKLDVELVRPIVSFTKGQLLDMLTEQVNIPTFQSYLNNNWSSSVSHDEMTMIDIFDYLQTESAILLKAVQTQPTNLFALDRTSVTSTKILEFWRTGITAIYLYF